MIVFGGLLSAIFIWSCILYLVARNVFENASITDLLGFLAEYVIEGLLDLIVAIGPGVTFLVGVLLATILITKIKLQSNEMKHFVLYVAYFFVLFLVLVELLYSSQKSIMASAILIFTVILAFPSLRFAVEEAGIDDGLDSWFTLICCFLSLCLVLFLDFSDSHEPVILAIEQVSAFCALAGSSTFLIRKTVNRNYKKIKMTDERKEE